MHLGNEALTSGCAIFTLATAATGLGIAGLAAAKTGFTRRQAATAAALGGFVFAAQMVNVQVLPFSSAHLVGGVLLAWVLGPAVGALTMAAILATQAFALGDGGTMTLGANIINMALLPAALVALLQRRLAGETAAGALAAAAVLGAAVLIVGEVAMSRGISGLGAFAWQMIWTHALIGVGEAMMTIALLRVLPILRHAPAPRLELTPPALAIVTAAALLLAVVSIWSSSLPDAYEAAMALL